MDLANKRIMITGGNGFLGQYICKVLTKRGCTCEKLLKRHQSGNIAFIVRSQIFDLSTEEGVSEAFEIAQPDIVIHLAAVVGGIGANQKKPGTFYYKNLMMGALLMEYARRKNIEKFVAIGTICAYPKFSPVPFKEENIWDGYPEETNAPYGIAKKAMLVQAQAYRQEFGFNSIYLLPVNLYGPNDNFDPDTSHVVPALIKKCIDAKKNGIDHIEIWGTGSATREFLYVEDAAEGIILATEKYNESDPINIGSGNEIAIKDLVTLIAELTEFNGRIIYDPSKPDGQPRRCLDTTKATDKIGFIAKTDFREGLKKTIKWYENAY